MTGPDRWHRWLLEVRFGGDAAYREKDLTEFLYPVRDAVLDRARLGPGQTLLDVGAGDGLIAFGALERLGASGRVIFSDISQSLLDHCRAAASAEGLLERCRFVLAPADQLAAVADGSIDAVTTRSVLIYVKDKAQAMREFFRVLRPGGRASLFEPVNVLMSAAGPDQFHGYDVTPVKALAVRGPRARSGTARITSPCTRPRGRRSRRRAPRCWAAARSAGSGGSGPGSGSARRRHRSGRCPRTRGTGAASG